MTTALPIVRSVLPAGSWTVEAADIITLDFDHRYRRRLALATDNGMQFVLDLAETTLLRDGDGLVLDSDGRIVRVVAASEELAVITPNHHTSLAVLAWHIGNRHLPAEIVGDTIRIRRNPVIEAFIANVGGHIEPIQEAFNPIGGSPGHHH